MASYTPNLNLKKPADGDAYDIADENGNMDKIDTAVQSLRESVSSLIKEAESNTNIENGATIASGYQKYCSFSVPSSAKVLGVSWANGAGFEMTMLTLTAVHNDSNSHIYVRVANHTGATVTCNGTKIKLTYV